MLTPKEKQVIADKMKEDGWYVDGSFMKKKQFYMNPLILKLDLSDAGLVRDWLVELGEWEDFIAPVKEETYEPTAWLFATENGEAVNFFRSFAKWCEEGK